MEGENRSGDILFVQFGSACTCSEHRTSTEANMMANRIFIFYDIHVINAIGIRLFVGLGLQADPNCTNKISPDRFSPSNSALNSVFN